MRNSYICALDLGSSKIACALAKFNKKNHIEDLMLESVATRGIKMGKVVDIQETSNSVEHLLKIVKERSGINVRSVYINIYGKDITTKHSRTVIPLAERGNKVITYSDVRRVTEEARILGSSFEEEILQDIPFIYVIDDQEYINSPIGLYGHKLGVDLLLILVKTSCIHGIHRLFNQLGYEIKHLFLSGLATSRIVLSEDLLKNGLYVFCDIGSDLTEIIVFENAILKHIETLSFGGDDLTGEIIRAFKIPFELAEGIKKSCAHVTESGQPGEDKEVMIKSDGYYKSISQIKICQIVTSKADWICRSIKDKLDKITTDSGGINSIFVSGRTILMDGFLEKMETIMGCPVKMATNCRSTLLPNKRLDIISSVPQFLNYVTSLGIVYEAMGLSLRKKVSLGAFTGNIFNRTFNRIKEIYQEYF